MTIAIVVAAVILLFLLISLFKINGFISFILVCIFLGITLQLDLSTTVDAIKTGMGNTLGGLVLILGLGAMLGKIVADSGAAKQITNTLVKSFGLKNVQWAVMIAGFIIGIPMFYTVGFVILIPLVFTIAATLNLPLLYIGIPMLASLSVTHGFLPPHPAPTALADMFNADFGKTMLYGLIVSVPTILISGLGVSKISSSIVSKPLKEFLGTDDVPDDELPSAGLSIFIALLPVILIGLSALSKIYLPETSGIYQFLHAIGIPSIAMLIAVMAGLFFLGIRKGKKMENLMKSSAKAISSITMVMLIIAGAGAFKQVLIETGAADDIGAALSQLQISPIVLAWLTAAIIRVCVGSATVAGMTAGGIMLPLLSGGTTPPELLVLAVGAGSIMASHVNDGGFWLFKEYFNLSIKDTLRSWTLMESSISIIGLLMILLLSIFV